MVGVGGAAAGAVEPGPAVLAVRPGVDVAGGELTLDGGVCDPVPDVAQLELLLPHELMAGVQGVTAMYSVPLPQPEIRL